MNIHIHPTHEALSRHAAKLIIDILTQNPSAVLGLATGGTPKRTYELLVEDHRKNGTSYQSVTAYNLDEYLGIPAEHETSYKTYMKRTLFDHIDIEPSQCFIPDGMTDDADRECLDYEDIIDTNPADIQILGIGRNGHIGFNEPATSFDSLTHRIMLDEKTRHDNARYFSTLSDVPKEAITMGIKSIMKAKHILLIASGKAKAAAIKAMLEGPVTPACPASALRNHDHVTVLLDEEAANHIKEAT